MSEFAKIIDEIGYSQRRFSKRYRIPRQTVNAWANGRTISGGWRRYLIDCFKDDFPDKDFWERL